MTRNQQIQNAAEVYTDCRDTESSRVKIAFEQGAKWADKNPIENYNTKLYIARDKSGDLYLSSGKPIKNINDECWYAPSDESIYLKTDKFPNVKWEDEEPIEVELKLKTDCEP